MRAEAEQLFDLESGPLVRGLLLRAGDCDHVLVLTLHHIICDGWTCGLMFKEIGAVYDTLEGGDAARLPAPQVQYADFAAWQQERLSGAGLQSQLQYWRRQLEDLEPQNLRTDRPRPTTRTFWGAEQQLNLPPELVEGLYALGRREDVSLFMILLAAMAVLLHRHGAGDDIAIGSPIAGRHHHQTEGMIGFFINTLVMRLGITADMRFGALLAKSRLASLEAFEHQDVPFEKLVETLDPKRDLSRNPLFDVFLNLVNFETVELRLGDMSVTRLRTGLEVAKFDLTVYAIEAPGELSLRFNYNADLFDEASITRLMRNFVVLLDAIVCDPGAEISRLPLLDSAERAALARNNRNSPEVDASEEQSLTTRLRQLVAKQPDTPAVIDALRAWSYQELDDLSDLVAQHLLVQTGADCQTVALLLGKSAQSIAAQLGVLKAGKAFVALDPFDPPQRLKELVADSAAGAVLTDRQYRGLAESGLRCPVPLICADDLKIVDSVVPLPTRQPDDLAYLLYTSGSTGEPKGVMQSDRNVIHHCTTYARAAGIRACERVSLLSSYTFDAAVVDTFGALLSGATLCLFDLRDQPIERLPGWIEEQRISVYHSTPTIFRHMIRPMPESQRLSEVRLVVLGGEPAHALDHTIFRQHFSEHCRMLKSLRRHRVVILATALLQTFGQTKRTDATYRRRRRFDRGVFGRRCRPTGGYLW